MFSTLITRAQGGSYNYGRYGIGFNASRNRPYADLKQANDGKSFNVTGYYNVTPYIPLGLEIQSGDLSGGNIVTDQYKRQYKNQYVAVIAHGDFTLGEIIDYDNSFFMHLFKDIYFGTGVGLVSNKMTFIQRTNLNPSDVYPVGSYTFPGQDKSMELMVPLRVGIDLKIYNSYSEPFMSVNIGYIHNVTWGEGLDGYTDPASGFKNNSPDQYRQIVVGVKFNFGSTVPYTKSIN
ncbi:hypothetical protein ACFSYC_02600 [Mucilaginibacter antarcticus]|uniref:Outer membrane protein with beta-barrel domain n=2 Tax=Mucilaginibacter antarcticus TaxID=1855725 RepID=A0ABW5XN39_9SPHI